MGNKVEELAIGLRRAEQDLDAADAAYEAARIRRAEAESRLREAVDAEIKRRIESMD